jgi:hypothetical protein
MKSKALIAIIPLSLLSTGLTNDLKSLTETLSHRQA